MFHHVSSLHEAMLLLDQQSERDDYSASCNTTRAQADTESIHADRFYPDDRLHTQFNSIVLYLGKSVRKSQWQMCCELYATSICISSSITKLYPVLVHGSIFTGLRFSCIDTA